MSKRAAEVSVLTANRLVDGIVVFLAADGRWVESIDGAAVARSADDAHALQEQGARDVARNLVVEPYLAALDVAGAAAGGRPLPTRMRERVRVDGPSILSNVPGYVPPAANGVSPLASNVRVSHKRGGEGSDPASAPVAATPVSTDEAA